MATKISPALGTAAVARAAGTSESFVRVRANRGEIPHQKMPDGTRVYGPEAVEIAQRLYAGRRWA